MNTNCSDCGILFYRKYHGALRCYPCYQVYLSNKASNVKDDLTSLATKCCECPNYFLTPDLPGASEWAVRCYVCYRKFKGGRV